MRETHNAADEPSPEPIKILSVEDLTKIARNKKTMKMFFLNPTIKTFNIFRSISGRANPNLECIVRNEL